MDLSEQELKRYTRQMMLPQWGEETQRKLKASTVFVAGAGGLGSPVAMYLAVAGVGHIRICDFDAPELSNLNRQILHDESRIGTNKAVSGQQTLNRLNPNVRVTALTTRIDEESVDHLLGDAKVIVDCMDNFPTRFVMNRAAIRHHIPLVHGSIWGLDGRISFLRPPQTACLECLFSEAPPKEIFPVLGATPGVIGTLQAMETIKYLADLPSGLAGKLLAWDGLAMEFRILPLFKDPTCAACAAQPARELAMARS